MKTLINLAIAAIMAAGLAACAEPEKYPGSGEQCTAEDPVMDIDSSDLNCVPAM